MDDKIEVTGTVKEVMPIKKAIGSTGEYKICNVLIMVPAHWGGEKPLMMTSYKETVIYMEQLKPGDRVKIKYSSETNLHPDKSYHNTHRAVWVEKIESKNS